MDFYGFIEAIETIAFKLHPQHYVSDKVGVLTKLIEKLKEKLEIKN